MLEKFSKPSLCTFDNHFTHRSFLQCSVIQQQRQGTDNTS